MRAMRLFICTLLGASLVLAACQSPTPTPTPEPTREPTRPIPATATPDVATARPPAGTPAPRESYPPRPTATLSSGKQSSEPNVFSNTDVGISLRYPEGWLAEEGEAGSDVLATFISPRFDVQGVLLTGPLGSDETAADVVDAVQADLASTLKEAQTGEVEAITLADGNDASRAIMSAVRDDGSALKINVTVAANTTGQAFVLLTFADPADYDDNADEIAELTGGLHTEAAKLSGIDRTQAFVYAGGESRNPREYDPATTHGSGNKLVFSGLVAFDPQLKLIADLAGSWDVTDGITYTFHLRPDARFHNGKPVTAHDVIYSWERAVDPATASDTVLTYLADIVGVREMNAGEADHISGLTALDDHTLQVVIDAPKPYFLMKLTYPVAFVVDQANVESGAEWWRVPNGTGPYRMARWDSFEQILYERNDDFYLEPAQIPYIIVQLFSGVDLRLYESGEVDVAGIGRNDVPRFQDPQEPLSAELRSGVGLCTGYIVFDVTQPPFDDVKVRQAFTLAFDREKYIDVVLSGIALPAVGVYPPGLPGYDVNLTGLSFDPERARQLLKESKYGSALPPIVFTDSGNGSDIGSDVAALAQMWQQNLGVTLTVENIEPDKYSDELHAGRHGQLFSLGWCADYPDPENFADALFHSGAEQNLGNYSNANLDALLEQARTEQDVTRRIALYQEAERLIVQDAPVMFTTHSLSYVLVKPYVQGYVLTPIDMPLERYLSLDTSKMK